VLWQIFPPLAGALVGVLYYREFFRH
jgi:hypothetical protein